MHTNNILRAQFAWSLRIIWGVLLILGCGNGTDKNPNKDSGDDSDEGSDSSTTLDSDSETPSDSATDSGTESDTETLLDTQETMPDLPELCRLDRGQTAASEEDDWSSETKGDGRGPAIANSAHTLMAWHYLSAEENAVWEIQVAPYDPEPDGGLPGPTPGPPGPKVNPVTPGPVSMHPDLTPRKDVFAMAWQDGRYDPLCQEKDFADCVRQIAFLTVDAQGQAVGSNVPVQITMDAQIATGPSVVATDKGYVVVWSERATSAATVMAVSVGENGALGTPQAISLGNDADDQRAPQIAVLNGTIVVVWGTKTQTKIQSRRIDENAEPVGDIQLIMGNCNCLSPDIAAGGENFIVSWSSRSDVDYELYTRQLNGNGIPVGEVHQATWTTTDIFSSVVSFGGGGFALAWISTKKNGESNCLVNSCKGQVLAALLEKNGEVASLPVVLSDDPNPVSQFDFSFDGRGWTALYELPRMGRKQVFYGRMVCD